jgi:hypothetical protein
MPENQSGDTNSISSSDRKLNKCYKIIMIILGGITASIALVTLVASLNK